MKTCTKEFRIRDYVEIFEKSLNYMIGTIFSAVAAGGFWYISDSNCQATFLQLLRKIHDNPRKPLCLVIALLSAMPYYFYYTLKDNTNWNTYGKSSDKESLVRIGTLYEICAMSIFYLLLQGDVRYSAVKLTISFISTVLIAIYIVLSIREKRKGERIRYFLVVIILGIIFYAILFVNSLYKWRQNYDIQDYSLIIFMILCLINTIINLVYLEKWDSCAEIGIISNRIKIIIPTISISIFPASLVYCFFRMNRPWAMLVVALVITAYEVVISCIKLYDERIKIRVCVIAFVMFVAAIPCIVYCNKALPHDLSLNWLVLVGIGIYMAAIKYGGYILKFLFGGIEKAKSEEKITNTMIWYRNSILGSIIFAMNIVFINKRYWGVLLTMIACALISERFISRNAFDGFPKKDREGIDKIYVKGKIGEFLAIILPPAVLLIENIRDFSWRRCRENNIELSTYSMTVIVLICLVMVNRYILSKMKSSKQLEKLPNPNWKQAIKDFHNIRLISGQRLSDKNVSGFWMIVIPWNVYILLTMVLWVKNQALMENQLVELCLLLLVLGGDWMILSRKLLDRYIEKMGEGKEVVQFLRVFRQEWRKCLQGLVPFREKDAEQFRIGNRLRPILYFMGSCYHCYDQQKKEDYHKIAKAACSIELIHKSSVIFDDYIDQDYVRNGKAAFHDQYPDVRVLILLGNAMLAKAQENFVECRSDFVCSDLGFLENEKRLSKIIYHLCEGCYQELSMADYDEQNLEELNSIIYRETVSLIKDSIGLGYRCFHPEYANIECENIEKLGENFGYIFQYLNDLEPFSQIKSYKKHKGSIKNFDFGRKNLALYMLYHSISDKEKDIIRKEKDESRYHKIVKLYMHYDIEKRALNCIEEKVNEMESLLVTLKTGNEEWVKAFKILFNYALKEKGWGEKVKNIP